MLNLLGSKQIIWFLDQNASYCANMINDPWAKALAYFAK